MIVFGTTTSGRVHLRQLLSLDVQERLRYRSMLPEDTRAINRTIKSALASHEFVDVAHTLCGSERSCGLFTADGKLIFYDGSHLTRQGARYLGERLTNVTTLFDPMSLILVGGGPCQ